MGGVVKTARLATRVLALQVLLTLAAGTAATAEQGDTEAIEASTGVRRQGRRMLGGMGQGRGGAVDRQEGDYSLRIGARINRSPMLSKLATMERGRGAPSRAVGIRTGTGRQPPAQAPFGQMVPFQRVPSRGAGGGGGGGGGALGAVRNRQQAAAPRANSQPVIDPQTGMYINERKPSMQDAVAMSRRMSKKNLPLLVDYGDGVDPEHAPKDYVALPAKMRSRREAIIEARGGPNAPLPRPPPAPRVPQHEKKVKISGVPKPVEDPAPAEAEQ